MKYASFGTISHGTLRTDDLLSAFSSELEWQIQRNGEFLSRPENFPMRDRLAKLLGEAQDAWNEDGETLQDEETAVEMVNDLIDALEEFAPPYSYFGAHEGDGSDFGYWPSWESLEELPRSAPADGGEWLHINERGNATLYLRNADGTDSEVWSVV